MSDYRVGNRQITNASYRSTKQPLSGKEEAQIKTRVIKKQASVRNDLQLAPHEEDAKA
jgi:hypothetical protein